MSDKDMKDLKMSKVQKPGFERIENSGDRFIGKRIIQTIEIDSDLMAEISNPKYKELSRTVRGKHSLDEIRKFSSEITASGKKYKYVLVLVEED